jgi:hypothetical protein
MSKQFGSVEATSGGNNGLDVVDVYYTAKDINATPGSRAAVQFDCQPGDIVTLDPFDNEGKGIGNTVGSVLNGATFLGCPHFVVVNNVHPDVNKLVAGSTTQRTGGWIQVARAGPNVSAQTKANMVAGVTALQVTNSSGVTVRPALTAITDTSTAAKLGPAKGLALETVDTSGAQAIKKVAWGACIGMGA